MSYSTKKEHSRRSLGKVALGGRFGDNDHQWSRPVTG